MSSQEERIAALEYRVARLEQLQASGRRPKTRGSTPGPSLGLSPDRKKRLIDFVAGEGALARIGISLLLAGLVFLVKYGLDRGWVNEEVRVILAGLAGVFLIGAGLRLRGKGRLLAQVLLGGGVGALYIAVFSAHAFYDLIPFLLAIGLMTTVTALCFGLSLLEESATLASVAAAAGLSTPFLLNSPDGSVAGLAIYIMLIQAAVAAVFWVRKWELPLVFSGVLTTLALMLGVFMLRKDAVFADRLLLQVAIVVALAVYGILPALRKSEAAGRFSAVLLSLMLALVPLSSWGLSDLTWELNHGVSGGLAAVLALGWAWAYRRRPQFWVLLATVVLSMACLATLTQGRGAGLWALVALAVQYLARDRSEKPEGWLARLLVVVSSIALFAVIVDGGEHRWDTTLYTGVGLAALIASARWSSVKRLTWVMSWILLLLFLQDELSWVGNQLGTGPALVTISWAALGLVLLVLGRQAFNDDLRLGGMLTIGLVVIRLLLVDLDNLDPIWRILIFLGLGGALLGMSYAFPDWWRREPAGQEEQHRA